MTNEVIQRYKDQREYLWNYFSLHSSQRLTTFNFYIVFSTVTATGCMNVLAKNGMSGIGIVLGLLLAFLSFVFWKVDSRNRQLIKCSEEALKYLEEKLMAEESTEEEVLKIFTQEARQTEELRKNKSIAFWKNLFSYATCFNMVFLSFGIAGVIAVIYALAK